MTNMTVLSSETKRLEGQNACHKIFHEACDRRWTNNV